MAPSPSRTPHRQLSVRGGTGMSAFSQLTTAVMDTLHLQSKATSSRSLKSGKSKVYIDNRTSNSRRSRRTSGRMGDSEPGGDGVRARRVSIQNRSSGHAIADSSSVDAATAAMVDASGRAVPRRPTMLSATQNDSFSESIHNLRSRFIGDGSSDKDMTRKRETKEVKSTRGDGDLTDNANDDIFVDDDDFDDEDDPESQRLRALAAAEEDELAYFSQRGGSFDFKVDHRWVLHPYGRSRSAWDCFQLGLITWMLITTPFELSFRELSVTTRSVILSLDYYLDVMFAVDIVLNFMTAVESDGRLHFSYSSIRQNYLYGWFLMDVLWTFPFYALTKTTGANIPDFMSIADLFRSDLYPLLRVFRLARILSLARIRRRLEFSLRISSSSSSLGGFVYSVLAVSHLFSCMFAYLAFGDEEHLSIALTERQIEDDSICSKYVASSYWAMMTIATVGYGDLTVKTNAGRLFSIVAMVMGGGIFAYGISNVVDLIQQLYIEETEHRHKMDQVNTLMHDRALPRKLRDEIRANFFHLRKATRENKAEDHAIVLQMSRTMQSHVADHFCMDMMPTTMPTLAGCNAEFIHDLYLAMEVQCYLPGEDIIRQDEFGSEMYFLFVGHVQVFVGHTKVALFGPNTCFGEFAIMNPKRPRLATIQAMDFCETHCITRAQLLTIVIKHPFVMRSILQLVQLTRRKALAILTDQTTRTRTLIQSLAGVWHAEGLQALMPPGVKLEDVPELQYFAAAAEKLTSPPINRLASVRMGLTSRKSTTNFPGLEYPLSPATSGDTIAASAETVPHRRPSIVLSDFVGHEPGGTTLESPSSFATSINRVKRSVRNMEGSPEMPLRMSGDDRIGLILHQMNVLLKRQEQLEQQLQQVMDTRQRTSSSGASRVSFVPTHGSPTAVDVRRRLPSIKDMAKTATRESPL